MRSTRPSSRRCKNFSNPMSGPTPFNTTPRAVLWDLDGTLVDTAASHYQAWQAEMAARGFSLTWEAFAVTFGQRNDTILRLWLRTNLSDEEIQMISASKETRYRAILREQRITLLPGAEGWLRRLRLEGWRQALATMTPRANVDAIFSSQNSADFFDALACAEDARHGKPDPEIFLCAAERLETPPARCIVVEDSPAGIEAARRAGMRVIGVNRQKSLAADVAAAQLCDLPHDTFDTLVPAAA